MPARRTWAGRWPAIWPPMPNGHWLQTPLDRTATILGDR